MDLRLEPPATEKTLINLSRILKEINDWKQRSSFVLFCSLCVADASFPFSRLGDRASEQANERAWGEQKNGEKWGGVSN